MFKQDEHWLPRFWFKYVDDTFAMTRRDEVDHLLEKLGQVCASVKFTKEMKNEGKLAFWDVKVHWLSNCTLEMSVYRKPTHTNKLLDFNSCNPLCHKRSTARALTSRVLTISSSSKGATKELK